MNKKGFTLIELLAVIVILAIIALIAVPAVLNIIEDSRKGAAEASARNIVSAAKTYQMNQSMKGETVESIDLSETEFKYSGEQAIKGNITFTNGKASGKLYVSGYCVEIKIDGTVTSEKMEADDCSLTEEPVVTPPVVTYKKYNNGEVVYFNPTDGVKCNAEDAVSTTGTNTGCMKFYAFLDSESDETVKLLLDHNVVPIAKWDQLSTVSSVAVWEKDPLSELLIEYTADWKQVIDGENVLLTPTVISGSEIAQITSNLNWENSDSNATYYFHTGNEQEYTGTVGTNNYDWLFDGLAGCEAYGCNLNGDTTTAYWIKDALTVAEGQTISSAWKVDYKGSLSLAGINDNNIGVRPVIEINKTVLD